MSELPTGWVETSLESLLGELETGGRPKGGVKGITDGIPSIGGEHLAYNGGFDFTNVRYVPKDFARTMSKGRIKKHDILVVKDGATTGKTSFVGEDFPFTEAFVNEHVFLLRTHNQIESKFVFNFLRSSEGQKRILENFQGSAQGGINRQFAPNVTIPLPPLNEQKRIVAKLDELLPKVEACKERLQKIPAILKRFYCSHLEVLIHKHDLDYRELSLDEACEAIVDCPHSTPKWTTEGEICLRTTNVKPGHLDLAEVRFVSLETFIDRTKRTEPQAGDVLFSREGTLGHAAVIPENVKLCMGQRLMLFRPSSILLPEYLCSLLNSPTIQNGLLAKAKGTASQHINVGDLRRFVIPIPSLERQQKVGSELSESEAFLRKIFDRMKNVDRYVSKVQDALLAAAFSGTLVSQDPTDQPASALLERIKATAAQQNNGKTKQKRRSTGKRSRKKSDKSETGREQVETNV